MKNKTVKIIGIIGLTVLGIIILYATFYIYDMQNNKVESISVYDKLKETEVFEGFFEESTQEFFESSGLKRSGEPINTAVQAKKLAGKVFYKNFGLDSIMVYRTYTVYHDEEAKMWFVYAYPKIFDIFPGLFGSGYCLLVKDDGYIVAIYQG